jgi:hypothetical protein
LGVAISISVVPLLVAGAIKVAETAQGMTINPVVVIANIIVKILGRNIIWGSATLASVIGFISVLIGGSVFINRNCA